jgi:hypothetical protein
MTNTEKAIAVNGTLEALSTRGPFIDLIPGTSAIAIEQIVGIEVPTAADRAKWRAMAAEGNADHALIDAATTVVHTATSNYLSTLTYKELRNRLRKAGVTFI